MKHDQGVDREGRGEGGSKTPVCSCGWKGMPVGNYNDYQQSLLNDQFHEHQLKVVRFRQERKEPEL